jgi:hypothetical protein
MLDWWRALRELPQATIAAVNGWCVGGGLCVLHACDLALAADHATWMSVTPCVLQERQHLLQPREPLGGCAPEALRYGSHVDARLDEREDAGVPG